jgi:bile acid-coenzyme A ligase
MLPNAQVPAFHAARLGPERWALRHEEDGVSWGELDRRSTRRAWALKAAGVVKDDLVTLSLPNGAAFYEFTFALWKLGATPHVVSWRLPPVELNAILDLARPRLAAVSDPPLRTAIGALPPEFGALGGCEDALPEVVSSHWKAMSSGGSTGRPKIIIDHAPALTDPDQPSALGIPSDSVILNPGPLYHNAPFLFTHNALFRGSSVVGMAKFDAEEALKLIDEYKVAWVNMVPTMMSRIWRLPNEVRNSHDLSSLRELWHMAAPMPPWLKEEWIRWLGPERIWELYGGTERQGMTVISGTEWLEHRGSVGRAVGCRIKVLNDAGQDAAVGEVGEIFLMPPGGPGSTYHYLGAEAHKDNEGWETIGDFGWLDADDYLYIADRRTDMILTGGTNIYPAEIEGALMEHPLVEAAVVIGLPHADLGAAVHAIVKPSSGAFGQLTEQELQEFLRERLDRHKIPRSFEFTTDILRDDAGKVRRSSLRDERIASMSREPM